jgi:hypothetical protein
MLNITTDPITFNYDYSEEYGSNCHGYYMFHHAHAYNDITVSNQNDGFSLFAYYITGDSYDFNDYNCPKNKLELHDDSHMALQIVNQFYDEDFEKEPTEYLLEQFEELQDVLPCIKTLEDMHQLYLALMANTPELYSYLDSTIYSDDINDYQLSPDYQEWEGIYIPKGF